MEFAPIRLRYVRVAPDTHVTRVTVQCAADCVATRATVTYVFTGLTEHHYQHWIQGWEAVINEYLHRAAQEGNVA